MYLNRFIKITSTSNPNIFQIEYVPLHWPAQHHRLQVRVASCGLFFCKLRFLQVAFFCKLCCFESCVFFFANYVFLQVVFFASCVFFASWGLYTKWRVTNADLPFWLWKNSFCRDNEELAFWPLITAHSMISKLLWSRLDRWWLLLLWASQL